MRFQSMDCRRVAGSLELCLQVGEFCFVEEDGETLLRIALPCDNGGYGGRGLHVFRDGEDKPDGVPAWHWDGDEDRPTLQPSIRAIGPSDRTLWHGYLTAGRLEACE